MNRFDLAFKIMKKRIDNLDNVRDVVAMLKEMPYKRVQYSGVNSWGNPIWAGWKSNAYDVLPAYLSESEGTFHCYMLIKLNQKRIDFFNKTVLEGRVHVKSII